MGLLCCSERTCRPYRARLYADSENVRITRMNAASGSSPAEHGRSKTLDDLRRERGDGWQWARAQTDQCPQCGLQPGAMDHRSLGGQLLELAGSWRTFLLAADDASVRTNPAPGVFSPIQYGAHVRDIQRVYGDRILLMLTEENPVFRSSTPTRMRGTATTGSIVACWQTTSTSRRSG